MRVSAGEDPSDRRVWNTIDKERAVNAALEKKIGVTQAGGLKRMPSTSVAGRRKEKTMTLRTGAIFC